MSWNGYVLDKNGRFITTFTIWTIWSVNILNWSIVFRSISICWLNLISILLVMITFVRWLFMLFVWFVQFVVVGSDLSFGIWRVWMHGITYNAKSLNESDLRICENCLTLNNDVSTLHNGYIRNVWTLKNFVVNFDFSLFRNCVIILKGHKSCWATTAALHVDNQNDRKLKFRNRALSMVVFHCFSTFSSSFFLFCDSTYSKQINLTMKLSRDQQL